MWNFIMSLLVRRADKAVTKERMSKVLNAPSTQHDWDAYLWCNEAPTRD